MTTPQDDRSTMPAGEAGLQPSQAGSQAGSQPPAQPPAQPDGGPAAPQGDGQEVGREGESDREGQGGYGNDTGFTGGTAGSRD